MSDKPDTSWPPFDVDLNRAFVAMHCHVALMELGGTTIVVSHMEGYRGSGDDHPETQQVIMRLEDWRQHRAMVDRMLRRSGFGA